VRVAPLTRRKRRPVGLVLAGGVGAVGEWSGSRWEQVPEDAKLYTLRKQDLIPAVRAGEGRMRVWRRVRCTGFEYRGHRITNLRGLLGDRGVREALPELIAWAEWARSHGANVGSMAGTSWSLWRSTIGGVFTVYGDEPDHEALHTGGRQGDTGRGVFTDVELWDLTAAYAHTLGNLAVPVDWRRVSHLSDRIPAGEPGYALAAVAVPPWCKPWGPLPERIGPGAIIYPVRDELEGIWSLDELRAAKRVGCDVVIRELYVASSHRYMFRAWWRVVEAGRRELPAGAAKLVKASSNTLWGRFLTGGLAEWWSWPDGDQGEPTITEERFRPEPASPALAGLVAGRIRARLYSEALTQAPVIACHTDGVIMPAGYHLSPNTGAPGRWRRTDRAERLELITAQAFRYRRPAEGRYVYRVSGVPPSQAPAVFSTMLRPPEKRRPEQREADSFASLAAAWDRIHPA